jgi:uncharacterized protein YegP (UPF0339 family)
VAERFLVQWSKDRQYYFELIAPNNETIAVSETYTTKAACIDGAKAVKKYAPTAPILDKTGT